MSLKNNKLLIISGPTATGKTEVAVDLAKKYNGELVSGDSCQIYKGLDIGTGKDQPEETPIHLIDIITPDQKFSVAQFRQLALETIKEIQSRGKLPILVGCSGFYIDSVINPNYQTFSIKPHKFLRFILKRLSVKALQNIYKSLNEKEFKKLNNSDRQNHYRLTRRIEIHIFQNKKNIDQKLDSINFNILHFSLTAPLDFLYKRIDQRVQKRMDIGFLDELKKLLKKYSWSDPGLQIPTYQCLRPYFDNSNKKTLKDCLQKWSYIEHSIARRQSSWSKTKSKATFVNITKNNFKKQIFNSVDKWYTKNYESKKN
jgi:tRNA dimethylallyltransferase